MLRKSIFLSLAVMAVSGALISCSDPGPRTGNAGGAPKPPERPSVETNPVVVNGIPVPAAVAMARPTARANTAIVPRGGGVRGPRHQAFVTTANTGDFDLLFEGDSITDWWSQNPPNGGKAVQAKYFGDVKVANFAVAGDTTQGVLWGLQNGEGQGHKPKAVMLMVGTNNTGSNTGEEIAEGVGAVVLELRKDFPDAKIMLLAIFPRGRGPTDAARVKNEVANQLIAKLDDEKHVFFVNLNPKFLNDAGALVGFRQDNLHPTAIGYEAWGGAVADTLKGWLK